MDVFRFTLFCFLALTQMSFAQTGSATFWQNPHRWVQAINSGPAPNFNQGAYVAHSSTKLLIWGGYLESSGTYLSTGSVYDFASGAWTALPAGGPTGRAFGCAAWDGTNFIIYGGWNGTTAFADGKKFNPTTNTWSNMAAGPSAIYPGCAWTGSELVHWGGQNPVNNYDYNTGSRYNSSTNTWTAMAASPLAARRAPQTILFGSKVFFWGGWKDLIPTGEFGDGAMYDLTTNAWTAISNTNAPSARGLTALATNGSVIVVYGGQTQSGVARPGGALYNPGTNTWTTMSTTNATASPFTNGVVAFDNNFFFYGGWDGSANFAGGKIYNPSTNTWTNAKTANNPSARSWPYMIQKGTKIFAYGGWGYDTAWFYRTDAFWYSP